MKDVIISLGGSLIAPDTPDVRFLGSFRKAALRHAKPGRRLFVICGGGKTARVYQEAGRKLKAPDEDLDWLGIHATRLNAQLMRALFMKDAHPQVIKDPTVKRHIGRRIAIAAGWKPGFSTDYGAVMLAKTYGARMIINMTNVDHVYTGDPKTHKAARPIKEISWKGFRKIVGSEWKPGSNLPFDPIASREAERLKLRVAIIKGTDMRNLDALLSGKGFRGTVIG
jgi:uridylate kinase